MRGLLGTVVAVALSMVWVGTAHAGYAYVATPSDGFFKTVTFEDGNHQFIAGAPPATEGIPCQILSPHKARCDAPPGHESSLSKVVLNTGYRAAQVRDISGDGSLSVDVFSGPLGDSIVLDDQDVAQIEDDGGPNTITLGTPCGGCEMYEQRIRVGPGLSTIDVRNGYLDYVECMHPNRVWRAFETATGMSGFGSPYPGEYNLLDSLTADPGDEVTGCKKT